MVCHRIRNASVLEKIWWKEVDNMDWAYWLAKIIEHSKILSFLLVGKYPNKEVKNTFAEDRK